MKICIVGLGSIGCRHLKNISKILKEKKQKFQIDAFRKTNTMLDPQIQCLIFDEYYDFDKLPKDYDIIFITNPTSMHYDTIKEFSKNAKNLFIEKPVWSEFNKSIDDLNLKNDGQYYVACPLRYTNVVKWIKENIDPSKVFSIRAICSTYLPDWRPNIDYRQNYSAIEKLGGGVQLDLIHELDYICYIFGKPKSCNSIIRRCSNLEISSMDTALYLLNFDTMVASVHLDYYGRSPKREIEIYVEDDVIVGDFIKNKIFFLKSNIIIDLEEQRDEYQIEELYHFLKIINGETKNDNNLFYANEILNIALGGQF